jgi:hypothetical protein
MEEMSTPQVRRLESVGVVIGCGEESEAIHNAPVSAPDLQKAKSKDMR